MKTKSSLYIKGTREGLGLTQKELARKLKIKRYNLAKYERGLSMPSGDLILKIQNLN